ncbi:hypothetical protein HZB07_06185 [Candidatus Saganbacteria bacterium]|nr:hypothetical protein [Candidatus Saganbacteria bacterium]
MEHLLALWPVAGTKAPKPIFSSSKLRQLVKIVSDPKFPNTGRLLLSKGNYQVTLINEFGRQEIDPKRITAIILVHGDKVVVSQKGQKCEIAFQPNPAVYRTAVPSDRLIFRDHLTNSLRRRLAAYSTLSSNWVKPIRWLALMVCFALPAKDLYQFAKSLYPSESTTQNQAILPSLEESEFISRFFSPLLTQKKDPFKKDLFREDEFKDSSRLYMLLTRQYDLTLNNSNVSPPLFREPISHENPPEREIPLLPFASLLALLVMYVTTRSRGHLAKILESSTEELVTGLLRMGKEEIQRLLTALPAKTRVKIAEEMRVRVTAGAVDPNNDVNLALAEIPRQFDQQVPDRRATLFHRR